MRFATREWDDWPNTRRLIEPIGNLPRAEAEARSFALAEVQAVAARPEPNALRESRGGSG